MKFYPLIDIRPSCHTLSETLERFADEQVTEIADAEVLLVGGGDGWMLDCMRTYHEHTIPFLGINCGTR